MSSNLKIRRICTYCKQEFIAQTTTTRYCSSKCNKRDYKAKIREGKVQRSNAEVANLEQEIASKPNEKDSFDVRTLDYLKVAEAASLLKCDRRTIYRLIKSGKLPAATISERQIRVLKKDVDALFNVTSPTSEENQHQLIDIKNIQVKDCYSIGQLQAIYNISPSSLRVLIIKNKIPRLQKGKFVYVPKKIIEPILDRYHSDGDSGLEGMIVRETL